MNEEQLEKKRLDGLRNEMRAIREMIEETLTQERTPTRVRNKDAANRKKGASVPRNSLMSITCVRMNLNSLSENS